MSDQKSKRVTSLGMQGVKQAQENITCFEVCVGSQKHFRFNLCDHIVLCLCVEVQACMCYGTELGPKISCRNILNVFRIDIYSMLTMFSMSPNFNNGMLPAMFATRSPQLIQQMAPNEMPIRMNKQARSRYFFSPFHSTLLSPVQKPSPN